MLNLLNQSGRNTVATARALILASVPALAFVASVPAQATIGLEMNQAQKIPGNLPFRTVELPCHYQPAGENGVPGYIQVYNATPYDLSGGLPVNYRLSSTGEEFTFHLPSRSTPFEQARVNHRIATQGTCIAWTLIR